MGVCGGGVGVRSVPVKVLVGRVVVSELLCSLVTRRVVHTFGVHESLTGVVLCKSLTDVKWSLTRAARRREGGFYLSVWGRWCE